MELPPSYIIRQVSIAGIERFYPEILSHVNLQTPTISRHWIILNRIGNDQILRSDLVGPECMDLIGTRQIRSTDIKGIQRIASESDKK